MKEPKWDALNIAIFERCFHPERGGLYVTSGRFQTWGDLAKEFSVDPATVWRRRWRIYLSEAYRDVQEYVDRKIVELKGR